MTDKTTRDWVSWGETDPYLAVLGYLPDGRPWDKSAFYASGKPEWEACRGRARATHIVVLVNRSFCVSSGIIEHRTGDAIARFYFTLRNTGPSSDRVHVTPVLVYKDGTVNKFGTNMLTGVVVSDDSVRLYRSPAYKYDARSHVIVGCGLLIDGHLAVPIDYI
jgi:hypothetical protein